MRSIFERPVHVAVYLAADCPKCKTKLHVKVYDYGKLKLRELEERMGTHNYPLLPLECQRCKRAVTPQHLILYEEEEKKIISSSKIGEDVPVVHDGKNDGFDYGFTRTPEEQEEIERGLALLESYFREREEEFWKGFEDFALEDWKKALAEITLEEFKDAYRLMGIPLLPPMSSVAAYRKDVLERIQTEEQKREFWRKANHYLVIDSYLSLGPENWRYDEDAKRFGRNRIRYLILNFPLPEELEGLRTRHFADIAQQGNKDAEFMFKRISQLTDELARNYRKINQLRKKVEELKSENADYQNKLSEAYSEIRRLKESQIVYQRDPDDIEKIQRLKSYIAELKEEIKRLKQENQLLKGENEEKNRPVLLEEDADLIQENEAREWQEVLKDMTIGLIGGYRKEHAQKEYPCKIITHTGEKLDPDFYQLLKQSDLLVVLTEFISHEAMWEAKESAIDQGKKIFFERGLSITKILASVAKKLNGKGIEK